MPEQVRILTVSADAADYAKKVEGILKDITLEEPIRRNDLRVAMDLSDDSLGKKIKRAVALKIPVVIIVGARDEEAGVVSVRTKDGEEKVALEELRGWIEARAE